MNPKQFFLRLTILIALQVLLVITGQSLQPAMAGHTAFLLITIFTLSWFCVIMYLLAVRLVQSPHMKLFIQLIMVAVFVKIILCVALILGYEKWGRPTNHDYIWSFLFIYITSTIYEVIFLEKTARTHQHPT